ncbi:MAG: DUF5689 domain-containing protein [Alistipes sp.]
MKNTKIFLIALLGLLTVGCYNDFDTPAPQKIFTDEDMALMGLEHVTIKAVKDKFGPISNTGTNDDYSSTKTLKLGASEGEESTFTGMSFWPEAANYYIKGKVISSDQQGNIYKSLFIWDGTAAIELKLVNDLYLTYKLDLETLESQWVYVKLSGLYLGNYRMMLSIGGGPSDGFNVAGRHKFYANSNIDNPARVAQIVLPGERVKLVMGTDIKVVNSTNYTSLGEADLARLVRFEGVKISYAGVKNQDDVTPPAIKSGSQENIYPSWIVTDNPIPEFGAWYYWAYSDVKNNVKLYGSVLMKLNDAAAYCSDKGVYSVRTSGFSRFASKPIPKDGSVGNVLGIYGVYAKNSNFDGGARDYAQYQISVSRYEDLGFEPSTLLDETWIKANTPEASYHPNVKNGFEQE